MANPPVCRIMDYGKFRYEEAQKAKEARKKSIQRHGEGGQVPPQDRQGRLRHQDAPPHRVHRGGPQGQGHVAVQGPRDGPPRARSRILDGVIRAVGPAAKVENEARLEGRNMSMVLAPDKKAQEAIKKAAEEAAAEQAAAEAAARDTPAVDANRRRRRRPADSRDCNSRHGTMPRRRRPKPTETAQRSRNQSRWQRSR